MEFRQYTPDLEVRVEAGQRLLCGIMVPLEMAHRIDETLTERFQRGAFLHQLKTANRVQLRSEHSNHANSRQLGYGREMREDAKGLYGEFRVSPTPWGDDYLALAADGAPLEWSIGFRALKTRYDGRTLVYTKAQVFELALVREGAYGELAQVANVRKSLPVLSVPPPPGMVRDQLLARMPARR